jgi:hypothetical protein
MPVELAADEPVMLLEQVAPALVAEGRSALCRSDYVRE